MTDYKCDISKEVKDYYDYLFHFIQNKVAKKEQAEDLTQEVFYQLALSCKKTSEIKNVKAWLFRVARNVLYKYYNQKQLEVSLDEDTTVGQSEDMMPEVDVYLEEMIEALPQVQQELLIAIDLEGKSYKELASELGVGLSALKMRVKRARELLLNSFYDTCDITFDKNGNFVSCTVK